MNMLGVSMNVSIVMQSKETGKASRSALPVLFTYFDFYLHLISLICYSEIA